jgi:hypothetical protein
MSFREYSESYYNVRSATMNSHFQEAIDSSIFGISSPFAPAEMHPWPSLRIRDSFKHGYLQKLELNLGHMKRSQSRRQGQGQQSQDQGGQQGAPTGDGKAPLLEDRSPSGSVLAGVLELSWDAVLLLTCCCFCCGGIPY